MNEERKDLTGALKALESNNQIITPEEREKRSDYITAEGERVSASLINPYAH